MCLILLHADISCLVFPRKRKWKVEKNVGVLFNGFFEGGFDCGEVYCFYKELDSVMPL